ncbi:hypothetical protein [Methylobacillus flagellatus]|uniref:hypothetical protein n=1 Tax=Methylobacillus flagellatus TaxID=405 RepID=UPI000045F352|nr:hypothetical protein [Methylobacillus flagellatus]
MNKYLFIVSLLMISPGCASIQPGETDYVTREDIIAADVMRQMRGQQITEY